ncbi:MAG: D-aminoacyl-tRNA deacylase [Bacteroidota bacterium]
MRAVIQRVTCAQVVISDRIVSRIGPGLLVLLGVGSKDTPADAEWMAEKTANLRIFERDGKMDLSLLDTGGEALVVSQFTLYGDCRRGRRPDFTAAARPETAKPLYEAFCARLRAMGIRTAEGVFGAMMGVHLVNDGPVTVILDREDR